MKKRLQHRRLFWLAGLLAAAFAGLGYRLVDLQVLRHEELASEARSNTEREILLEPRRGDILDSKGNLLATSLFVKTVCADPSLMIGHSAEVAGVLAGPLGMPREELEQRLGRWLRRNQKGETVTNRYVVLKRKVAPEDWEKARIALAGLLVAPDPDRPAKAQAEALRILREKSVFVEAIDDQQRFYPNQGLAAHVLGYVSMTEPGTNGPPIIGTAGVEGIERSFNAKLAGARGWRVTEADRQRREQISLREQDVQARDGCNVVLTIDSVIQHIVETALAEAMERHSPISISGLVVRPRTGEILALATLPSFDPNHPGAAPPDARRNRIITDVAEPGSTFKIVVISGALNERVARLGDAFDCEHGRFFYAGRVLHDHGSYDTLSVEGIVTKSSNIGAAKIGIKLGPEGVYEYIRRYGFGGPTGIPLPGEVGGIVHPVKSWSKVSIAQLPMGHGVAVTRLQMTMAMCAIANQGLLMRPMLVDRLEDARHEVIARYSPQPVRRVISEAAARDMVQALKTVTGPDGTAPKAALEHYSVAGKTGTAQKVENGAYVRGKYFSSFIGFFPSGAPELCVSITMDEPRRGYYGGQTAAPVFKEIAERAANYLNIRPDLDETGPGPLSPPLKTAALRPEPPR